MIMQMRYIPLIRRNSEREVSELIRASTSIHIFILAQKFCEAQAEAEIVISKSIKKKFF